MARDRLDVQRAFRAKQRSEVEAARRMPVEQARHRLRELADRERSFLADQRRQQHDTARDGDRRGRSR